MFFKQHDIVSVDKSNYLVLSVEDETLLLFNLIDLSFKEVTKKSCTRVHTSAELCAQAIAMKQAGNFPKAEVKKSVMDYLKKCSWIENASMNHRNNSVLYTILENMDTHGNFDRDVEDIFFNAVNGLKANDRTTIMLSGMYDDVHVSIKVSLVKKDGLVGVNHVKRIFGDDGIFGNIKKSAVTKAPTTSRINSSRSFSGNQPNRLAS